MLYAEMLQKISRDLQSLGRENYINESRWILCSLANLSNAELISHMRDNVNDKALIDYEDIHIRLCHDEPLQYVLKSQQFYGLDLFVDNRVLIPRRETEELVDLVIKVAKSMNNPSILDLCTGSGAIILSLANNIQGSFYSSDISSDALDVAKYNANKHNLANSIKFYCGDLFSPLKDKKFDIIISNPPYISREEINKLDRNVLYEPRIALDGGLDGMFIYDKIFSNVADYLNNEGYLFLEIGYDQGKAISRLASEFGFVDICIIRDIYKNERIFIGKISK